MAQPPKRGNGDAAAKGVMAAVGAAGAAALGWLAYSKFGINHKEELPPAINAGRKEMTSGRAGRLSYYEDRGARGKPLLLLHSVNAAASAHEVRPIFDYYRRRRPVFALDLPGFGFSGRSDRVYSPELYAHAILDWIQNGVDADEPVDVLALSTTCEFVARAAEERGSLFHSIAMIGPTGFSDRQYHGSEVAYQASQVPLWSQAFYDGLVTRPSIQYFLKKAFAKPVDVAFADYSYRTSHQPGARFAPLYFVAGKLFTPDVRERYYAALTCPVLVITGNDEYVGFDFLPGFLNSQRNWRVETIVPSKGMPHFDEPARTFEVLDQFWRTRLASYEAEGARQAAGSLDEDWLNSG
ncbi:MAG TPA: alpha/beta hydrolase [Bryobacteraceae bacterium]|jgi:pimeloyl-ACP methyl ester carboxylesterase|nr:alpha/beta hydrolase [Bryobacteraceae bacterium]